jgi:hypothetical protein
VLNFKNYHGDKAVKTQNSVASQSSSVGPPCQDASKSQVISSYLNQNSVSQNEQYSNSTHPSNYHVPSHTQKNHKIYRTKTSNAGSVNVLRAGDSKTNDSCSIMEDEHERSEIDRNMIVTPNQT